MTLQQKEGSSRVLDLSRGTLKDLMWNFHRGYSSFLKKGVFCRAIERTNERIIFFFLKANKPFQAISETQELKIKSRACSGLVGSKEPKKNP